MGLVSPTVTANAEIAKVYQDGSSGGKADFLSRNFQITLSQPVFDGFQTESALREAEALIRTDAAPFNPLKLTGAPFGHSSEAACNHGMCSQSDSRDSESIPDMGGQTRVATTGITGIFAEPEFIIELARVEPSTDSSRVYATFLITTIAWGRDANSVVRLQSAFRLHAKSFVH